MARRVLAIELKEAKTAPAIAYFKSKLESIPEKRVVATDWFATEPTDILFDE
jgi:hypothetical protein